MSIKQRSRLDMLDGTVTRSSNWPPYDQLYHTSTKITYVITKLLRKELLTTLELCFCRSRFLRLPDHIQR